MTFARNQDIARPIYLQTAPNSNEAAIEAYLRTRHEATHGTDPDGEPVRGRDPWSGIGL